MPVENERKYVLDLANPEAFRAKLAALPGATSSRMAQAYFNENTRLRGFTNEQGEIQHVFTFKMHVGDIRFEETNPRVIEIETPVSKEDASALFTKTYNRIDKTRVKVPHGDLVWEVDFFYGDRTTDFGIYLVMAEVELPEGVDLPGAVPDFITDHLLYRVRRDDPRFFNSKLSFVDDVLKLMTTLRATVADVTETEALKHV